MKTSIFPLFASAALLLTGCSFSGQDTQPQTEISSVLPEPDEETTLTTEFSHIEIIQETTVKDTDLTEEQLSVYVSETETEPSETETQPPEDTLPVDENSIAAAYSSIDGSDIIYFGNIYCDSSLDNCGVLFLTADGRVYGGICSYLGDFRGNSYADYLAVFTDSCEFDQLSADKAELLTKYAISADPEGDFSEKETDFQLEYVSWYECISYNDLGEPQKILAHADEYGYTYSTHDVYIAEIAKTLYELGIINEWQDYCLERLS